MSISYFFSLVGGIFSILFSSQSPQDPSVNDSIEKLYELSSEALKDYDHESTVLYSLQLIDLSAEKADYKHLYAGYNFLGITYEDQKDSARAKQNYLKALETAIASQNDTLLWGAYNNLAGIYAVKEETVEKGFQYYDKAIEVVSRLNDPKKLFTPIINKGWTHLDYGQYERAYPYLLEAQKLLEVNAEDELAETQLLTLFGRYYAGIGDYGKGRDAFEASIKIVERDTLILEAAEAYKGYSEMLFKNQEYEEAYNALEQHLLYKGKIFEQEKLREIEAAYTRYETDEYRKNLELAEREQVYKDEVIAKTRETSIIMTISVVVMLLFLILLFRNNRIRKKLIRQLKDKNKELEMAKEKAERLSLLKTRFFSTVSHELRTPLYGVVGLTSLLLEDNKDETQVEDLKSLKFSADYLLALINDVLQMNKMESDLMQLQEIPFNVEELLQGIVKSFEFTRVQNKNEIQFIIDEKIPKNLIGDSVRLSQILMNLIGNAIKFTEEGRVWVKIDANDCDEDNCNIAFEVGDTGVGIPEDKQREIFEEFSQLRSSNYKYQGTGLGLPIVEKLLDLFGSSIELESEEGKGSIFRFQLLFKKGEVAEDENSSAQAASSPKEYIHQALIVDDNRINQVVTKRTLEKKDFECEIAENGYKAIERLKEKDFDVVLMDVNMPGMNGMEATREIRKFNKDVPVIALTAVEIDEMREKILQSGMNDIIVKPYETQQLFHTVYRNLLVPVG